MTVVVVAVAPDAAGGEEGRSKKETSSNGKCDEVRGSEDGKEAVEE